MPLLDLKNPPDVPYGMFLDPHTGIPLPKEGRTKATSSHAPLPFIVEEMERPKTQYGICFDQSSHRKHESALSADEQKETKKAFLRTHGIVSFYYISHAPFLFMTKDESVLRCIRDRLISL